VRDLKILFNKNPLNSVGCTLGRWWLLLSAFRHIIAMILHRAHAAYHRAVGHETANSLFRQQRCSPILTLLSLKCSVLATNVEKKQ